MNSKQKEFLKELHALMEKYSISRIHSGKDSVAFISNGNILEFSSYTEGKFEHISTGMMVFNADEKPPAEG